MKTDVLWDKEFWIGMAIYHVTTPWIEVIGTGKSKSNCIIIKAW